MKIAKSFVAIAVSVLMAGAAQAATVTLTLYPNQDGTGATVAGSFRITAKVSGGDNGGLAGFGGDLVGAVTSINNQATRAGLADKGPAEGPAGFTFARSADNAGPVVVNPNVAGFQDLSNSGVIPIYGFGQTASSFAAEGITPLGGTEGNPWAAELLIATGTFTGTANTLNWNQAGINKGANVFIAAGQPAVKQPEVYLLTVANIPEPTSVVMGALSLLGFVGFGRRRNA